jgi:hypothetical protein
MQRNPFARFILAHRAGAKGAAIASGSPKFLRVFNGDDLVACVAVLQERDEWLCRFQGMVVMYGGSPNTAGFVQQLTVVFPALR